MICTNCRHESNDDESLCPKCGATQYPSGSELRFLHSAWGDVAIGIFLGGVLLFAFGVGILVNPVLWMVYRQKYKMLARGIGIMAIAPLVLILGVLLLCTVSPPHW